MIFLTLCKKSEKKCHDSMVFLSKNQNNLKRAPNDLVTAKYKSSKLISWSVVFVKIRGGHFVKQHLSNQCGLNVDLHLTASLWGLVLKLTARARF